MYPQDLGGGGSDVFVRRERRAFAPFSLHQKKGDFNIRAYRSFHNRRFCAIFENDDHLDSIFIFIVVVTAYSINKDF